MKNKSIEELIPLIEQWANSKGLLDKGNIPSQLNQLSEEIGELTEEVVNDNIHNSWVELGDCLVVLIVNSSQMNLNTAMPEDFAFLGLEKNDLLISLSICKGRMCSGIKKGLNSKVKSDIRQIYHLLSEIAYIQGTSLEQCLNLAYNKIKDRKGKMKNGQFIKQSDLVVEREDG